MKFYNIYIARKILGFGKFWNYAHTQLFLAKFWILENIWRCLYPLKIKFRTLYPFISKGLILEFFYLNILFLGSDTWPTLYKAGEKQVANMLWFEEGLYADLPYGYVDNLTEFYTSENNKHVQQVKFPPR